MRNKKNIGMNAILNVIKSGLSVLFPLITYPYALRILGANSIGKVTYCSSIISYFILFAMIGIATYAVREGSKIKEDREKFNIFVSEIFTLNVCFTIISYLALAISLVFVPKFEDYKTILIILSAQIAFTVLGIDWINNIYEDYLFLTLRSIFANVASLILLFTVVKSTNDFYLYALLTVLTTAITCVSNIFYCRKYTKLRLTRHTNYKKHLKPMLVLFANSLAISVYVNIDTTMLGWLKGDYYVGLYAVSAKIYTIVKSMLAAVYIVAVPRLAYYIGTRATVEYKKLFTNLFRYLSLLLIPAGIGLISVSREVIVIIGGKEFIESTLSLQILSIGLIFSVFGGLVTSCLNVTLGREKDNLRATMLSAIVNVGLNLFFIPMFVHNGAAFTTAISELFVFSFCLYRVKEKHRYMDYRLIIRTLLHSIIGSTVLFLYICVLNQFVFNPAIKLITSIFGGVIVYVLSLVILRENLVYEVFSIARNKILKNRKFLERR